jgi:uncharacterized protein (TIGR02145 family)
MNRNMKFEQNFFKILVLYLTSTLIAFTACKKEEDDIYKPGNPITDIEGNTYQTVWIGNQNWMAENLKTTTYNNGTPIDLITDSLDWDTIPTEAYCWYDNNQTQYAETFGALYNWYAVETGKLCPDGWHVPTSHEWVRLEENIASDGHNGTEGTSLKATSGWNSNGNGTDDYGFTALPGGVRNGYGEFKYVDSSCFWWSTTEVSDSTNVNVWYPALSYNYSFVYRSIADKGVGMSIRCLKD